MPKISIIIPTIGRKSLVKALESVLNQTFQDFEVIVTDDTEDEKAKPLLIPYLKDKRIKYVVNRKYMHGPTGNKNNGLDQISGEYFGILDDDDELFPQAFEKLYKIAKEKGYEMIFANCFDNIKGEFTGKHYEKSEEVSFSDIICGKFEGEYWGLTKTSLLGKDRFFEETWGGEDLLWWKLWKKAKKGFYLHEVVRKYTINSLDAVSKQVFLDKEKLKRAFLNYKYSVEIFKEDFKKLCPRRYLKISLMAIYFAKLSGNYKEILKIAFNSFNVYPKGIFLIFLWALFCLIFPKNFVFWFSENLRKKLKEKIK